MHRHLALVILTLCPSLASTSWSQEAPSEKPAGPVVAMEVLIADFAGGDTKPHDAQLVEAIRAAEKQGKLSRVSRVSLTSVAGRSAMAQFGERAAIASGRSGPPGGGRGFPGGGEGIVNYTYQHLGTMVQLEPQVDGDSIVLDCKIEISRLAPIPPTEKPEPTNEPRSIESINSQATVRLQSGKTVILSGHTSGNGLEARRTYILVTATLDDAKPK